MEQKQWWREVCSYLEVPHQTRFGPGLWARGVDMGRGNRGPGEDSSRSFEASQPWGSGDVGAASQARSTPEEPGTCSFPALKDQETDHQSGSWFWTLPRRLNQDVSELCCLGFGRATGEHFFFWLLQQTNTYFSISVCQALVRVGIINNISQYLSSESLHSRRRGRIQPNSIYCDACCQKNMNQVFWVHSAVVFVGKNQGGKKQRRWHLICTLMSKVASQGSKECFRTSSIYSFNKYVLNVDYVPAQGCQGLSDEVNGHDPCPCSRVGEQANK